MRRTDKRNWKCTVIDVVPGDGDEALKLLKKNEKSKGIAGKATDIVMFAGSLREGTEGVESDTDAERFAARAERGFETVAGEMAEDGSTLKGVNFGN